MSSLILFYFYFFAALQLCSGGSLEGAGVDSHLTAWIIDSLAVVCSTGTPFFFSPPLSAHRTSAATRAALTSRCSQPSFDVNWTTRSSSKTLIYWCTLKQLHTDTNKTKEMMIQSVDNEMVIKQWNLGVLINSELDRSTSSNRLNKADTEL